MHLGIKEIFLIFAVMAFIAIPFVASMRGKYSLQYMESRGHRGNISIASLLRNRQFTALSVYIISLWII
jgi:hypothetical protein